MEKFIVRLSKRREHLLSLRQLQMLIAILRVEHSQVGRTNLKLCLIKILWLLARWNIYEPIKLKEQQMCCIVIRYFMGMRLVIQIMIWKRMDYHIPSLSLLRRCLQKILSSTWVIVWQQHQRPAQVSFLIIQIKILSVKEAQKQEHWNTV